MTDVVESEVGTQAGGQAGTQVGTEVLGLRERKRLATRRAILRATIQLVRERGIDGATVDEISRIADISPRTFFNYFPSKEAALLGDGPALPSAEAIDTFIAANGRLLDDIADLLVSAADSTLADRDMMALRKELLADHPHLVVLRMASMQHFEEELSEVVARRLARTHPGDGDAEALLNRARLLTYAAAGAMRHAWLSWVSDSDSLLADQLRASLSGLEDFIASDARR